MYQEGGGGTELTTKPLFTNNKLQETYV